MKYQCSKNESRKNVSTSKNDFSQKYHYSKYLKAFPHCLNLERTEGMEKEERKEGRKEH